MKCSKDVYCEYCSAYCTCSEWSPALDCEHWTTQHPGLGRSLRYLLPSDERPLCFLHQTPVSAATHTATAWNHLHKRDRGERKQLTADTSFNTFRRSFLWFCLSETASTVICGRLLLRYYRKRNVGQNNLDQNEWYLTPPVKSLTWGTDLDWPPFHVYMSFL